jgi:hypothetical protein
LARGGSGVQRGGASGDADHVRHAKRCGSCDGRVGRVYGNQGSARMIIAVARRLAGRV